VCGRNDVVVRNNYLLNIGGDGIVAIGTDHGLIEHNRADRTCLRSGDPDLDMDGEEWWPHTAAIWLWRCRDTVMQFNSVRDTGRQRGNNDGQAYDFDYGCIRCILQFCYSENNHGMLLVMDQTRGNVARYNISQNDQRDLILVHGNVEDGNLIHNNVFYLDHSTVNVDFHREKQQSNGGTPGALIKNNIFYATGQGRFRAGGSTFSHNCYYGPWKGDRPDDKDGIHADPMFVAAGVGSEGFATLGGYRLQIGSPCLEAGDFIASDNSRDFFGNPLREGGTNIGAFEHVDGESS
jgi:hypothetical protein